MEDILKKIDELGKTYFKAPKTYHQKRSTFLYQAYKHAAIEEIKLYFLDHKDENPISTIEEFRYMMDCFACNAQYGDQNFMFSVYYDVATNVLDALLCID